MPRCAGGPSSPHCKLERSGPAGAGRLRVEFTRSIRLFRSFPGLYAPPSCLLGSS
jgi:hypothetical protein